MLLAESFQNRWNLSAERRTLGGVKDFGLILNSSIAGHLDRSSIENAPPEASLMELEHKYRDHSRSELAGGRLILTNLKLDQLSLPAPEGKLSHALPVMVNDPDTRLETAAALNANFPPVFSDAGVDIDKDTRYWVTDGGAIDNRGMETLLYALRQTFSKYPKNLPRMVVLIADASGLSTGFTQDRGTRPALAAGSKMTSQLSSELVGAIQQLYCDADKPDDFGFVYLFMPDELRKSESFGTHWMLQPRIKVRHANEPEVSISGNDMVQVLKYLYTSEATSLAGDAARVLNWARATKSPWNEFVAGIKKGAKLPGSGSSPCKAAK